MDRGYRALVALVRDQNKSGPIRWVETSLSGESFTYVKATEGTNYVNPTYLADSNVPKYVGMAVGSYHYAQPSSAPGDAAAQANFFANTSIVSHFPTLPPRSSTWRNPAD